MSLDNNLKKYKISIVKLAELMDVSRPTVYKLIDQYNSGLDIQNEKHKLILDFIHKAEYDEESVKQRLDKYSELIKTEKTLGSADLDIEKSDLLLALINIANKDLHRDDAEINIHRFLIMLMNSYRSEECLKDITKYFLVFNGFTENKELDSDEKKLYSNLFKVFYLYKNSKLEIDEEYYQLFFDKMTDSRKRIMQSAEETEETVKNKIIEDIAAKIEKEIAIEVKKQIEMGIKPEEIDIEEIKKNIRIDWPRNSKNNPVQEGLYR